MRLWLKMGLAIVVGVAVGAYMGPQAECLRPIGTLFINLLSMLIIPLIVSSVVLGVVNTPSGSKLGRIGTISLLLYAATTVAAIGLGIALGYGFGLGQELQLVAVAPVVSPELPSLGGLLTSLVPKNPVQAFAEGNVLQIIVISLLFGAALKLTGEKGRPIVALMEGLVTTMTKLTGLIMVIAPFAVCALMATATGTFGIGVLWPVGKFLGGYYVACGLFLAFVVGGMVALARLHPLHFFRGIGEALTTAASTCSSSATLPCSLQCATDKLGISKDLAHFLLPLGTAINMNGSSLFQTMATIFIAQAYGVELLWPHLVMLALTVILATIGTASIPGGGLIMLSIVLASVGVPLEGIALLAGVDRLRDMATTAVNVASDAACTLFVAKREGDLNEAIYTSQPAIPIPQEVTETAAPPA